MKDRYWVQQRALGNLHISIVRNDGLFSWMWKKRGVELAHVRDLGWFLTIHVGSLFLNIDWTRL